MKEEVTNSRYIVFMRSTLFVLKSRSSRIPVEIKAMQGLQVEAYNSADRIGILIKHRDGIYPEKAYCFESSAIRDEWLRHLK